MKKTVIAALLGATLLTGGAIAAVQNDSQSQDTPKHRMMHDPLLMADVDKDGVVTRAETIAAVDARFAKLDANKDGKITAEDRQAARGAMGREGRGMRGPGMKRGPDANGDGIVTIDEQRARALKRFDFVDRNGDGRADQAERALVREMLMEMGGRGRGHHGGPGGRHHGGEMPPPPPPATPNGG